MTSCLTTLASRCHDDAQQPGYAPTTTNDRAVLTVANGMELGLLTVLELVATDIDEHGSSLGLHDSAKMM